MTTGVFCALTRRAYGGIESHNHNIVTHLIEMGERITVVAHISKEILSLIAIAVILLSALTPMLAEVRDGDIFVTE